jgi:hypothetical protein
MAMSSPDGLFDALYRQFLLRDVFGKVLPGLVIVACIGSALGYSAGVKETIAHPTFLDSLFVLGVGWVAGFAVQSAGKILRLKETFPRASYDPAEVTANAAFNADLRNFRIQAEPHDLLQFERFTVIKEATGNTAVAIVIGAGTLFADAVIEMATGGRAVPSITDLLGVLAPLGSIILLFAGLLRQHKKSSREALEWMQLALRARTTVHPPALAEGDVPSSTTSGAAGPIQSTPSVPRSRPQ